MVASSTPCERSSTSSLVGQRVAAMRRRRSSRCSSEISRWKGRTVVASVATDMCVSVSFVVPSEELQEEEEDARRWSSAKGPECVAELGGEELRLLPGGEVAAPVGLVEVREAGENHLDPAA